jgi:group I intron endonuclease
LIFINCIYCIRNKINNKIYIGKTNNFDKRIKKHIQTLNKNKHHNKYLQNAWNKYESVNFDFFILVNNITSQKVNNIEYLYILLFESNNKNYG